MIGPCGSAFGGYITDVDVENAVLATLKEWMPTYLREMERHHGFDEFAFEDINSWRAANLMEDRFPEEQIPSVQVQLTSSTNLNTLAEEAGGHFRGTIDVLVQAGEPEYARQLASYYQMAMGLLLTQKRGLGGLIPVAGFGWLQRGVPTVGKPGERWLAIGSVDVIYYIESIFDPFRGPVDPQEPDGEGEPPDYGLIESHHVNLIAEE